MDSPMQAQLGSCLAPGAALINHSCDPNAHHLSEGPELVVRSSRTIAKNEEITISYIDVTRSFEERQEKLFTAYAFACQCCRCTKGFEEQGEIMTGDSILDAPIRLAKSQLDTVLDTLGDVSLDLDSQELSNIEAKFEEICQDGSPGKPLPINFFPIPLIYRALATRFEMVQQWEKALHCLLKTVYVIDPLSFPDRFNPHRVEHLVSLCQLER